MSPPIVGTPEALRRRPARPVLVPGLRRLWRDANTLQLGLDPGRALLLLLPEPSAARVLGLLGGNRTEQMIVDEAGALGVPASLSRELLALLRDAGLTLDAKSLMPEGLAEPLLTQLRPEAAALAREWHNDVIPAQAIARRIQARILVRGNARFAVPIAASLAQAGVGHVDPALEGRVGPHDAATGGLLPTDRGRPRAVAAAEAIVRAAPTTNVRSLRDGRATFVLEADGYRPPRLAALGFARLHVAHLDLHIRDGTAVIGPLVPPLGSPCLNCLDLYRRDRDPAWPALLAQLATDPASEPACPVTTTLAATGYATEEILRYIDGRRPRTLGTTVELRAPGDEVRRHWPAHPSCDCTLRRGTGAGAPDEVE